MAPRIALRLALIAAPLLLAACETLRSIDFSPEPVIPPPCPRAVVGEGAGHLTRFDGTGKDATDVVFDAEIFDLAGSCVYDDEEIEVDMQVQIVAGRGPAATDDYARFDYFVAVTSADGTILAREAFDAAIELSGNQTRNEIIDEIEQTIPIPEGGSGGGLVIIVGFEMTPEELEFNRQQGR
ncbi:MAG: hypothetical protein AB7S71_18910 [Dongiaceae bacterium]